MPRFTPTGEDFPLGIRTAVLPDTEPETKPAAILREVSVRAGPDENATVEGVLGAGAQVRIKRVEGAWALVERNSREIGYVPSNALLVLERN